jgi:3-hydroxyacyl-CoA dehydrogenase
MPQVVSFMRRGRIALAVIDHPPVNALSHAVRAGLMDVLQLTADDAEVAALVIVCRGRTFCAGADIKEFGKPMVAPLLREVIARIEASPKPVITAMHGTALGGGLELALASHFRVALADTRLGLPEVKLGIIPGAGGTQRLPRLVKPRVALTMIAEGKELRALEARAAGLIDEIIEGELEAGAVAFAERVTAEQRPQRRTSELPPAADEPEIFEEFTQALKKKQRGFLAPLQAVKAVRMAYELPFAEGEARAAQLSVELLRGAQSRAQRHAFAAERDIAKIPGLPADTPTRDIRRIAVVGTGTMGRGIAMACAGAGFAVTLIGRSEAATANAMGAISASYAAAVKRGALSETQARERSQLLTSAGTLEALAGADLMIESIAEDMDAKRAIFGNAGRIAKPGAILASNTSFLDLAELARASGRPADVAGMHFFNPAHVMRLLENVRTAQTAPDVSATLMQLGKRLGKVAVLVGAAEGFVANRMLARRSREALFMLEEGATPSQVDRVLVEFGFPLGPFAVADLGGLDVVLATRRARWPGLTARERAANLLEQLNARGRLGQKSSAGWYRYDAERRAAADPEVEELIVQHSAARGITRRTVSDAEILERCLYALINEGARLIGEGVVPRPHEIDVIWMQGLGFPVYRGGPMFYADEVGLKSVHAALLALREQVGAEYFTPAALIERLAAEGRGFYSA